MSDYEVEPSGAAQHLVDSPILNEIFDALETDAIEQMISARPADDECRSLLAMEVRAIRSVRKQLSERASGKAKPKRTDPAA
jgi:hypothetical protein